MKFYILVIPILLTLFLFNQIPELHAQSNGRYLPVECNEDLIISKLSKRLPAFQENPRFSSQDQFAIDSNTATSLGTRDYYFLSKSLLKEHHKRYPLLKDTSRAKYMVSNHAYPVDLAYNETSAISLLRSRITSTGSCLFKVGECVVSNCQNDPDGVECQTIDLAGARKKLRVNLNSQKRILLKLIRDLKRASRNTHDKIVVRRFQDKVKEFQKFQESFQSSWPETIGFAWHCYNDLEIKEGPPLIKNKI